MMEEKENKEIWPVVENASVYSAEKGPRKTQRQFAARTSSCTKSKSLICLLFGEIDR